MAAQLGTVGAARGDIGAFKLLKLTARQVQESLLAQCFWKVPVRELVDDLGPRSRAAAGRVMRDKEDELLRELDEE